jgi:hypothetical protein
MPSQHLQEYREAFREHEEATRVAKGLVTKLRRAAELSENWQSRLLGAPGMGVSSKNVPGLAGLPAGKDIEAALLRWKMSLERLRHLWGWLPGCDRAGLQEPPFPQPG